MAYEKDGQVFINKNPKKKHFRQLTEEEIERAASKPWKKQKPVFSTDPGKNRRLQNLTGPKTKEGKARSLANLRPGRIKENHPVGITHGGYIRDLLNDDERSFFKERRNKYIDDFELNESSDAALLDMCIMEEVIWRRLMLYQAENPSKSVDRPLTECQKRLREALKSLGMTREQRVGQKINVTHSISDLAARVAMEIEQDARDLRDMEKEEQELLQRKRERTAEEHIIDVSYEEIDDEKVGIDD